MIGLTFHNETNPQNEVARDYWGLNENNKFHFTVKHLEQKYTLKAHQIIKLVNNISTAYSTNFECNTCTKPYLYSSRSSYSMYGIPQRYQHNWTCSSCSSKERENLINKKKDFLSNQRLVNKRSLVDLSTKELVYLLTLIKHSSDDGITINYIPQDGYYRLTPSDHLDNELLEMIDQNQICILSTKNSVDRLQATSENGDNYSHNLFNVIREVWIEDYHGLEDIITIEELLSRKINNNLDEKAALIEEISIYECIAFLTYHLKKRGLQINHHEQEMILFKKLLKSLPVNQICRIAYIEVKDLSDYLQIQKTLRPYIKPSPIRVLHNNIEKSAEDVIANNKQYEWVRMSVLPQSIMSRVLFNILMNTDDGGFKQKLSTFLS